MQHGNFNNVLSLTLNDSSIFGDERIQLLFEMLAAAGAFGYGDFEHGSDRITLNFAASEYKLKRKHRLTGSKIEKFGEAQHMLTINMCEAACKLLANEEKIPDQIGLEIQIAADLIQYVCTHLLTLLCSGAVAWDERISAFLEWLTDLVYCVIWRGDTQASITAVLDLRQIKAEAPHVFIPTVKVERQSKAHPALSF